MDKVKVQVGLFKSFVLPKLKQQFPDPEKLQAEIDAKYEIADENGDAVMIDVVAGAAQPAAKPPKRRVKATGVDPEVAAANGGNANGGDDTDDGEDDTDADAEVDPKASKVMQKFMENVLGKAAATVLKSHNISVRDRGEDDPQGGFKTFGEYARSVKAFALGHARDERLWKVKAPTNYANEGVGADGGFLVPTDYTRQILRYSMGDESLLPRTRQLTVSGNTIVLPTDESQVWGTSGVQASWTAEGGVKPDSKPVFGEINLTLHKLTILVPVTDELLQDSFISLGTYIGDVAGERIMDKVNTAIVSGTGAGQPLGYRTSNAYKQVAKETGQTSNTVNITNLAKMYAAMPPASINRAVWLYNPAVFSQLVNLTIGQMPVWFPDAQGGAGGRVFGRPALPSQQMAALGTHGDIEFVDLSQYITISKGTGIEQATSIHLYFDRDITTFRFVLRVGGRPWMTQPITGRDGTTTFSPFVSLADR